MRESGGQVEIPAGLPGRAVDGIAARIARWTASTNNAVTAIPGLVLHRWEHGTEPTSYLLGPSICLIGQGRKRVLLGDETYVYDAESFLLTSIDLPLTAQIFEASPEAPYLGLTLALDLRVIAQMTLDHDIPLVRPAPDRRGLAVSAVTPPLAEAVTRLLDLLDAPRDLPVLSPLALREVFYRLLTGEQGARLRQILSSESHGRQIAQAIDWLKQNFQRSLRVEDLAGMAGLSLSAFHSHFRAMTAMSSLQFQKKMRLSEARRLMFMERIDASTAAFRVGYESATQFNREYRRLFGAPPLRDVKSLNQVTAK